MLKKLFSFGPLVFEEEETHEEDPPQENSPGQVPSGGNTTVAVLSTIIVVLGAVLAGGGYFYYLQVSTPKPLVQAALVPASPSPMQLPLVDEVGKHIVLPNTENPTVATVSDITKLINQPFFLHAKNGDKVLIYPKSQIAYLYRPSIDKIITVAPVSIEKPQAVAPSKLHIPGSLSVLGAATTAAGMKFEK